MTFYDCVGNLLYLHNFDEIQQNFIFITLFLILCHMSNLSKLSLTYFMPLCETCILAAYLESHEFVVRLGCPRIDLHTVLQGYTQELDSFIFDWKHNFTDIYVKHSNILQCTVKPASIKTCPVFLPLQVLIHTCLPYST